MSSVGIPGLILLVLLIAIGIGVIWLLLSILKKGNSSKEILDLKKRVSELEERKDNDK